MYRGTSLFAVALGRVILSGAGKPGAAQTTDCGAVQSAIWTISPGPNVENCVASVMKSGGCRVFGNNGHSNVVKSVRPRDSVADCVINPRIVAAGEWTSVGVHVNVRMVLFAVEDCATTPRGKIGRHAVALGERDGLEAHFPTRIARPRLIARAHSRGALSIKIAIQITCALRITSDITSGFLED